LTEKKDTRKPNRLPRVGAEKKAAKLPSKSLPVNGTVEVRRVKCGRANCRCAKGELHGPYTYVRVYGRGKRRRKYVKNADVSTLETVRLEHKKSLDDTRNLMRLLRMLNGATQSQRAKILASLRENSAR